MKSLLSYAVENGPVTVLYVEAYGVGVYAMTDRTRRSALLARHYDNHGCPGGIWHCVEGKRLWDELDPRDQIAIA